MVHVTIPPCHRAKNPKPFSLRVWACVSSSCAATHRRTAWARAPAWRSHHGNRDACWKVASAPQTNSRDRGHCVTRFCGCRSDRIDGAARSVGGRSLREGKRVSHGPFAEKVLTVWKRFCEEMKRWFQSFSGSKKFALSTSRF